MKKKIIIGVVLAIIITGSILIFRDKEQCNDNALKFKEIYEKYNKSKEKLNIKDDNPMVKINKEDIVKKINKSDGVIFFGTPKENESRILVKVLLEVSKDYDCEVIYYYDLSKLDKESDIYKELQTKLGDYKLKNGTIIFYKKGEIVGYTEYKDNYKDMKKEINTNFTSISSGMCEVAKQC